MFAVNKTTLAIGAALLCSLAAPAQAQTSVQFYGKLYAQVTQYSLSEGTSPGTAVSTLVKPVTARAVSMSGTGMESPNSYIGFRGAESLGGGLSAIFQLEGAFGLDDGSLPKGVLFNRDTFVGLKGGFGTIKLGGRMDTVYKTLADQIGFFGVSSGNTVLASNILAQGGFGTSASERFHERPGNTVLYASPDMAGFQALFGYSLGEVANSNKLGNIYSVGGKYDRGAVYLALAYEQHVGLFGGSNNLATGLSNLNTAGAESKDGSVRATARYAFNTGTQIELDVARTRLGESGGTKGHFQSYQHTSMLVSAEQKLGAWTIAGALGHSQAGSCTLVGNGFCNTAGLDATMSNLGVAYSLSKRTRLYALYSNMHNGRSANFSNAGTAPAPGVGQSLRQTSAGLLHSF
ncbi:porin [Massilia sp. S19_KUP03_FR1]|uniref:porin n=1 Tax=Massilia sp. S19_KUP03_FR1 TaxID=3025503 RepID=UPI002FCDC9F5